MDRLDVIRCGQLELEQPQSAGLAWCPYWFVLFPHKLQYHEQQECVARAEIPIHSIRALHVETAADQPCLLLSIATAEGSERLCLRGATCEDVELWRVAVLVALVADPRTTPGLVPTADSQDQMLTARDHQRVQAQMRAQYDARVQSIQQQVNTATHTADQRSSECVKLGEIVRQISLAKQVSAVVSPSIEQFSDGAQSVIGQMVQLKEREMSALRATNTEQAELIEYLKLAAANLESAAAEREEILRNSFEQDKIKVFAAAISNQADVHRATQFSKIKAMGAKALQRVWRGFQIASVRVCLRSWSQGVSAFRLGDLRSQLEIGNREKQKLRTTVSELEGLLLLDE